MWQAFCTNSLSNHMICNVTCQAMALVVAANVHTWLRISTTELHSHNPIRACVDCHIDQPDPVWEMQKKATSLKQRVTQDRGETAAASSVRWTDEGTKLSRFTSWAATPHLLFLIQMLFWAVILCRTVVLALSVFCVCVYYQASHWLFCSALKVVYVSHYRSCWKYTGTNEMTAFLWSPGLSSCWLRNRRKHEHMPEHYVTHKM